MMIGQKIACLAIGYLFGLFQTGYLYGKWHHMDIRKYGSGNSGTTNALRVMGKKAGAVVFLGDAFKAVFACLLVGFLFGKGNPDMELIFKLYAGLGVVLGHNYPFYLKFKGGKGIAATAGVILSMGDFRIVLSCLAAFVILVAATRYVSLGSLAVLTIFLVEWVLFTGNGTISVPDTYRLESIVLVLCFAGFGFFRHKANIGRLIHGTENKLGAKKE